MDLKHLGRVIAAAALLALAAGCCDHCADLSSLAVSRDGERIASLCGESRACVWDTKTGKLIKKIQPEKFKFSSVAYSPAGNLLATGFDDGAVEIWDSSTGNKDFVLQKGTQNSAVFSETFSPSGEEIATAGMGWPVTVWSARSGKLARELADSSIPYGDCWWKESQLASRGVAPPPGGHGSGKTCLPYSLAYSPSGGQIAVGSMLWLRLWDTNSGQVVRNFPGASAIGAIAFSPDGRVLAAVDEGGMVSIWDANAGTRIRQHQLSTKPLRAIAYSSDGQLLAASGWDGNIYICDSRSGARIQTIVASRGAVNWILFLPDNSSLVSGGPDDDFIAIWQFSTGKLLRKISCSSAVK